jgi:hypothetical protein
MARPAPRFPLVASLLLLLAVSLAANALLYRKERRPLFDEFDRTLIERTIARSPEPDQRRSASFPIVMHWGTRTCVELRRYDRRGYSAACFDRGGRMIEEVAGSGTKLPPWYFRDDDVTVTAGPVRFVT